jgi:hypothetical protein
VWGHRPDKPVGVYSVSEPKPGAGKVVVDSQTQLMWHQASAPTTKVWVDAKTFCEQSPLAGFDDWRLPSNEELESLVDYSMAPPGPTIDQGMFPGTMQNYYWSANLYTGAFVWNVDFNSGTVNSYNYTSSKVETRCVRGNNVFVAPVGRYIVSADGEVATDSRTKLEWQRKAVAGKKGWVNAKAYCDGLVLSSKSDWRLPWVRELSSIVDKKKKPCIDLSAFPSTLATFFWSASLRAGGSSYAWRVDFASCAVQGADIFIPYEVRCVRGS